MFRFVDRWQTSLRDLFDAKPDRDRLLALLEKRDQSLEAYLGGEWETYEPVLTNVTAGTADGSYMRIGNKGELHLEISAGTATAGAAVTFTLPPGWTCARVMPAPFLLQVGGVSTTLTGGRVLAGGTTVTMYASTAGADFVAAASVVSSAQLTMELV